MRSYRLPPGSKRYTPDLKPGQHLCTPLGTVVHVEVWKEIERRADVDPASLSDWDLTVVASFSGEEQAQEFAQRREAAKNPPVVQSAPAPVTARGVSLVELLPEPDDGWQKLLDDFVDGDDQLAGEQEKAFDAFVSKHAAQIPLLMWLVPFMRWLKGMQLKNKERNARIDAVEARLAALEERPIPKGLTYKGVWIAGEYEPGDFVTHDGHVWACKQKNSNVRPAYNNETSARCWTLAVKAGRDARSPRP